MPAVRLSHRRRSSLAAANVKAGFYGVPSSIPPRPVICTFAPNITPVSYNADPDAIPESACSSRPPSPHIFPACDTEAPAPPRRRNPPGKRRSQGYIPRPPNAFMLFRADFVRQKHVPGSIETNHGSLSKIIGNCWRALPLEEKGAWEYKAKIAKAEHKKQYPEYRFRPVHNKNKEKKEKVVISPEGERRCEEVAQLLLDGMKGDQLSAAVRNLDKLNAFQHAQQEAPREPQMHYPRRPSSVPLPDLYYGGVGTGYDMQLTLPFVGSSISRSATPVGDGHLSRSQRMMYGQRRASTVQPVPSHSWSHHGHMGTGMLDRDPSPLPEVDTSLFQPEFLQDRHNYGYTAPPQRDETFNFNEFTNTLPNFLSNSQVGELMSPLDPISPHESYYPQVALPRLDIRNNTWPQPDSSCPSTSYSGSPSSAFSEVPLPLHAPQAHRVLPITPESAAPSFNMGVWSGGHSQEPTSGSSEYDYSPQSEPVAEFSSSYRIEQFSQPIQQQQQLAHPAESVYAPEQQSYNTSYNSTVYEQSPSHDQPIYDSQQPVQQLPQHCGPEQQQYMGQQPNVYVADLNNGVGIDTIYEPERFEFNDLIHGY